MTGSLEDYLEAIYFLTKLNSNVRVTDLADYLSLSKPSVNRAVNILKEKTLVEHETYGLLKLTHDGLKIAEGIAFRHATIKKFLHELILVDKDRAELEACSIEHSLSDDTVHKLAQYLKEVGL